MIVDILKEGILGSAKSMYSIAIIVFPIMIGLQILKAVSYTHLTLPTKRIV